MFRDVSGKSSIILSYIVGGLLILVPLLVSYNLASRPRCDGCTPFHPLLSIPMLLGVLFLIFAIIGTAWRRSDARNLQTDLDNAETERDQDRFE
jgi:hypothetical protein